MQEEELRAEQEEEDTTQANNRKCMWHEQRNYKEEVEAAAAAEVVAKWRQRLQLCTLSLAHYTPLALPLSSSLSSDAANNYVKAHKND